ncbi:hypothetical protein AU255_02320 [Methyloprofundus sedimenti]|uniref:Uncharacterized protein n=1 Tax=Methyloprofundus sedimenti TaxID=1420851 RepID=A0A1V8M5T6_9GAMM|nr:hypothetical protein AU255_02320 [Methyloprofundus sedimenti]
MSGLKFVALLLTIRGRAPRSQVKNNKSVNWEMKDAYKTMKGKSIFNDRKNNHRQPILQA